MPLITTVTPDTIAVALKVAAPASGSATELQWSMWIGDADMLIQMRMAAIDPPPTVDQDILDYVVREAVVAQVKKPDDSTQVTMSIDDASTTKTYQAGTGRVTILGEWWALLGLASTTGQAFMVDLMPPGAGLNNDDPTHYWWWA